jgi:hypothetical protein
VTRDEISLNAALEVMAETKRHHVGGDVQLTAAIQVIVNTALDREREECAKVCATHSEALANMAYKAREGSVVSLLGTRPSDLMMCADETGKCANLIRARSAK